MEMKLLIYLFHQPNSQAMLDYLRSDQETWAKVGLDVLDFVATGEVGKCRHCYWNSIERRINGFR